MALQDRETHSARLDCIYTTVETVCVCVCVIVRHSACHFSLCGKRGFDHLATVGFPFPTSFCLVCLTAVTHLCPVSLPPLCLSVRSGETCIDLHSLLISHCYMGRKTEAGFWKGQKLLAVLKFHHAHSHCGLKRLAKVHLCDLLGIIQLTEINEDVELPKTL